MRRTAGVGATVAALAVVAMAIAGAGTEVRGIDSPAAADGARGPGSPSARESPPATGLIVGRSRSPSSPSSTTSAPTPVSTTTVPPPPFPRLEPAEFGRLVDALAPPPGTHLPIEPPAITGDIWVDARIRALATARGYRLRPVATVTLVAIDGALVHPDAAADLRGLLDEARYLGLTVHVRSGHRSVERQRQIFDRELTAEAVARAGRPYTPEEIAGGAADEAIDAVLQWHSVPGYSRHHSGLAVDLDAGGPLGEFAGSPTEAWLRADGFHNALRFGFVPSYPEGGGPQGPLPEPWEYVYVGTGAIRCAGLHVEVQDPEALRSCPLVTD